MTWHITSDDELLPKIQAVLAPKTGSQAWLIWTVGALRDDALEAIFADTAATQPLVLFQTRMTRSASPCRWFWWAVDQGRVRSILPHLRLNLGNAPSYLHK